MSDKTTELSVSTEVLEKMAEIAAKEVDGVTGLCKKKIDLKGVVKSGSAFKGVEVENTNGTIRLCVYLCVKQGKNVREISEAAQQNIKERIQSMTGTAVSRVDVVVADLEIPDEKKKEKEPETTGD